jgi:hypothetical protein
MSDGGFAPGGGGQAARSQSVGRYRRSRPKTSGKDIRQQGLEDRHAELERTVKKSDAILFSDALLPGNWRPPAQVIPTLAA